MVINMKDNQIVDLFWKRSELAISETARKYGNYCKCIALNILFNKEDAEECVNDTYLMAWNSMPENRPSLLSSYLGKITRNLAFNKYKFLKTKKRGGGEMELVLHELEDCISSGNSVEETVEADLLAKAINDFLKTLNKEMRTVFVLRYWHTYSISFISTEMGMSESKVKSILFRCRNNLKTYLDKYLY